MNNIVNFFSLCCPCANYHAIKDFDKLDINEKVLVSAITTLVALITLPLFGSLAILTFRQLVHKFSAKEIKEENELKKTSVKVQEQTEKKFPKQSLQQEIKKELQSKNLLQQVPVKKVNESSIPVQEKIQLSKEKIESLEAVQATPLIHAIVTNDLARVKRIVQLTNLALVADKRGCLPIHWAAQEGRLEILQFLISYNDVNALGHQKRTALSYAAQAGHEKIVNFLLSVKADANLPNHTGNLPIHWATAEGHLKIVETLLNHSNVNAKIGTGNTLLGIAAANGRKKVVEYLLQQKADANIADNGGSLPLHWAAGSGFAEIVQLLIRATSDINTKSMTGHTALSAAVATAAEQEEEREEQEEKQTKVVEILLKNGANANIADHLNSLPIHHAALRGYLQIVKVLQSYKSEINTLDNWGRTPLRLAVEFGKSPELVTFLLEKGANPNIPDKSKIYPLDVALKENFTEIVKILEPITKRDKSAKEDAIEADDLNWDFEESFEEKKPALSTDLQNAIKDLIEFSDDEEPQLNEAPNRPPEIQNALNDLLAFADFDDENSLGGNESENKNSSAPLSLENKFVIDEDDDFDKEFSLDIQSKKKASLLNLKNMFNFGVGEEDEF